MKNIFYCLVAFFCIFFSLYGQNGQTKVTSDEVLLQNMLNTSSDSLRLVRIEQFIAAHEKSTVLGIAYGARYGTMLSLKRDSAAFASARLYVQLLDERYQTMALNNLASDLAFRNIYLDSATVFIDTAIAVSKRANGEADGVLLSTKALVFYGMKKFGAAESLQQEIIQRLPSQAENISRYAQYFSQLGLYQIETKGVLVGVQKIALACLVAPNRPIPIAKIDSLLHLHIQDTARVRIVRDSLFEAAVIQYGKNSEDHILARGVMAVGLAKNGVLQERAILLAREAYTLSRERTIEDRAGASASLGITLYYSSHYDEAEKYLQEAVDYAAPVETELFYTLGMTQEKLSKFKEAFDTYLDGIIPGKPNVLYARVQELQLRTYPTLLLDSVIAVHQLKMLQYTPEKYYREKKKYSKNEVEKTVLAELFTGSECKPCLAADKAFDYLRERFKENDLAILEYHLSIPMPDPMANKDADDRAKYYDVRSTPTAIIDGVSYIASGGNLFMAKNKFMLYSDFVEHQLKQPATVSIHLDASMKNLNTVELNATAQQKFLKASDKNYRLRVVLAEETVQYKGANTVSEHKYVVRKFLGSVDGAAFNTKGKAVVKAKESIPHVVAELKNYLELRELSMKTMGVGFREKKHEIDAAKLFVVAFVQNDSTREILQAKLIRLK